MDPELQEYFYKIKERGLTAEQEQKIISEVHYQGSHEIPDEDFDAKDSGLEPSLSRKDSLYDYNDLSSLQDMGAIQPTYMTCLSSVDELLERDKRREKDG